MHLYPSPPLCACCDLCAGNTPVIIGATFGAVVGLALLAGLALVVVRRRRNKHAMNSSVAPKAEDVTEDADEQPQHPARVSSGRASSARVSSGRSAVVPVVGEVTGSQPEQDARVSSGRVSGPTPPVAPTTYDAAEDQPQHPNRTLSARLSSGRVSSPTPPVVPTAEDAAEDQSQQLGTMTRSSRASSGRLSNNRVSPGIVLAVRASSARAPVAWPGVEGGAVDAV
jgi:LPXTG-motif cell wall-anchored protein